MQNSLIFGKCSLLSICLSCISNVVIGFLFESFSIMYGAFSGDAPNVMKNASFLILVLFCLMKVFIAGQIPSQIGVPMIIK